MLMKQKNYQHKTRFFFSLLIMGFLFGSPLVIYGQEPTAAPADQQQQQQQEEHDSQDLEKLLKRYNTDSEKVLNDASKINSEEQASEVTENEIDEMRPSDTLSNATKSFTQKSKAKTPYVNKSFSEDIKVPLARLQKLSEEELVKMLKENTRDSKFAPYMDQFPRFTLLTVRLIKDKEAIPSAVKIIEDRDKLVWFGGIMISTFLLGFLLERLMRKEGRSILGSIGLYMFRVLILTGVRLGIIIYFYKDELSPAAKVFSETFM